MILDLFKSKLFLFAAGALGVVLLGMAGAIYFQSGKIEKLQVQLAHYKAVNDGKDSVIALQSRSILDLKKQGEAAQANLTLAIATAGQTRVNTNAAVQKILKEFVPKTCPEAVDWGRKKAAELSQGWP